MWTCCDRGVATETEKTVYRQGSASVDQFDETVDLPNMGLRPGPAAYNSPSEESKPYNSYNSPHNSYNLIEKGAQAGFAMKEVEPEARTIQPVEHEICVENEDDLSPGAHATPSPVRYPVSFDTMDRYLPLFGADGRAVLEPQQDGISTWRVVLPHGVAYYFSPDSNVPDEQIRGLSRGDTVQGVEIVSTGLRALKVQFIKKGGDSQLYAPERRSPSSSEFPARYATRASEPEGRDTGFYGIDRVVANAVTFNHLEEHELRGIDPTVTPLEEYYRGS